MTIKLYAVKDLKVGFEPPFARQNDDVAIREFESAAKFTQGSNRFRECPTDYELWKIGEYNLDNGKIVSNPVYLSNLIGVVTPVNLYADIGENKDA